MKALDAVCSRRSIRRYGAGKVPDDALRLILEAAMSAPSAGNQQPWHFIVVRERSLLDQIPDLHPHALMCREAPLAILVCGDPSLEKHKGYWVQDCAAATENLLIAVHALGLGGVWVGVFPRDERVAAFRRLFDIPESVVPFALVPLGHPAETKPSRPDRFNEARVHWDIW